MPSGRTDAHINEHEFLTEILRTVLWGADDQCLMLLGVTDNSTSNMWFAKGRARRGVGLRLTRAFHRWMITESFRYGPFYCRSERNIAADYISRASGEELLVWESAHAMTRIDPTTCRTDFCLESKIRSDIVPAIAPEPTWTPHVIATPQGVGLVVGWQPSGFTLCRSAHECGFRSAWIASRHSTLARIPQNYGISEYLSGAISPMGGLAKDLYEARQFWEVLKSSWCGLGILLTPRLIDLEEMEFPLYSASGTFDSVQYGDVLADRWNVYSFGSFDLRSFLSSVRNCPLATIGQCYQHDGLNCAPDEVGFHQMTPVSGSTGQLVHVCQTDGTWLLSQHSHVSCTTAKDASDAAVKWPLLADQGILPSAGQRIQILGGHSCFADANIPDDAYANDAIWRSSPISFWNHLLRWYRSLPIASSSNSPQRTGSTRPAHVSRMLRWPWRSRLQCQDVIQLSRVIWFNVEPSFNLDRHRRSVQLGPGGCIGLAETKLTTDYPMSDALSDSDSIPDADFSANHTWGPVNRSLVQHAYAVTEGWRNTYPVLSYKMITRPGVMFNTGMYEFAELPFVYEVARRMLANSLVGSHLEAPDWLLEELFFWFCPNITWRNSHTSFYKHSCHLGSVNGRVSFDDIAQRFAQTTDTHLLAKLAWIRKGRWNGVPAISWSPDVRVVRAPWNDDDYTVAASMSIESISSADTLMGNLDSPRAPFVWRHPPFTNGGISSTFDRNLYEMRQLAKFELLTQSIGDSTRDQYLK